jgi:DNA helicase HerA-like ATPase
MVSLRYLEACIGKVREVDGTSISVRADKLEVDIGGDEQVLEIGTYLNCGGRHGDTICMISRIQLEELERKENIEEVKTITLTVIGSVNDGKFQRGVVRLPTIGCSAYLLSREQLKIIYGVVDNGKKKYFLVTAEDDDETYLNLDKLLSRHVAILGTTGSGKSFTVASIVQSILRSYPYPRMVFFDIHNEYSNAFGHGKDEDSALKEKTCYTTWDRFTLPYWFLDLDEFLEIYYPGAGTNQVADIKRLITELKRDSHEVNLTEKDRISCDSPVFFSIDDLIKKIKANREIASPAAAKEHWQKLELKIVNVNSDSRYEFLRNEINSKLSLGQYFSQLFGIGGASQKYLNILDLSGLPSEVRNVCIGVLSRLCFDYKYWDLDPEDLPLVLILEEAHTYIPEENSARFSLCRERVERIAKEGRKYGLSLIVVSQRPSNISTTVLSQCGTFVTLRLTNDNDQNKVKRFLPDTLGGQADMLPSLRDGEALVSGDGISLPKKVRFRIPVPAPRSNDVRYHTSWSNELRADYSAERVIRGWKIREKQNENK